MKREARLGWFAVVLMSGLALAACGAPSADDATEGAPVEGDDGANAAPELADAPPPASTDVSKPVFAVCSDAQVVAIERADNMAEVIVAGAVADKLQDSRAREFADRMLKEHSAQIKLLDDLARSKKIEAQENDLSTELEDSARLEAKRLSKMSGAELDKSYMAHELLDHLQDLGIADHMLAPSVRDRDLAKYTSDLRAVIVAHETMAQPIVEALSGKCGSEKGR